MIPKYLQQTLIEWTIWIKIEPVFKDYLIALIEAGINTYWINPVTFVIERCPGRSPVFPIEEVDIDDSGFDVLYPLLADAFPDDRIVIPLVYRLTVENIHQKPSGNALGGGDYWVPDDFRYRWTINTVSGITFGQLIEAVFRVKRNKYDLWHEVFSGIDTIEWIDDHSLRLVLDFSE